jgi:hypothetical protein
MLKRGAWWNGSGIRGGLAASNETFQGELDNVADPLPITLERLPREKVVSIFSLVVR